MILRSLVSTAALALVLGGPAAAFSVAPNAEAPPPLLLAQTDDPAARLQAAQEAFEAATIELEEAQQAGGDVEAARARLEAAQEELRAAQELAAQEPAQEEQTVEEEAETEEVVEESTDESVEELVEEETETADEVVEEPAGTTEEMVEEETETTEEVVEEEAETTEEDVEEENETTEEVVEEEAETTEEVVEEETETTEEVVEEQAETTEELVEEEAEATEERLQEQQAEPEPRLERPRREAAPDEPGTLEQQAEPERRLERPQRDAAPDEPRTLEQQAEPRERGEGRPERARREEGVPPRAPESADVVRREGDRIIIQEGDQYFILKDENRRMRRFGREAETEQLRGGLTRTIVTRPNGVQVITVRDQYGEIVRRVRRLPDGREIVLVDFREPERPVRQDWERRLPPLVVQIPRDQYIVEMDRASQLDIRQALTAPPVEEVERVYTLQEVRQSERLRDKVRRVDLDTITFEFNSADIPSDQIPALASVGRALEDIMEANPDEVYLIEGHTDAVGSDLYNLELSDRRAESVAIALSENFDVPPENLVTQGYGEQYLKVPTEEPARENRRVTIRRITPLISSAQ